MMNDSRLILVLLVSCLMVPCFGQDIDPDTFDFDNFDAYLTTESYEYSTLDPLSFFPSSEEETETTEVPSENDSEVATVSIDTNEPTTASPLKKFEDSETKEENVKPKNDDRNDDDDENPPTTATPSPMDTTITNDIPILETDASEKIDKESKAIEEVTTEASEEEAGTRSEQPQKTSQNPQDVINKKPTETSSAKKTSTENTINHDITTESTDETSPRIEPTSTETIPSTPSFSTKSQSKILEVSTTPTTKNSNKTTTGAPSSLKESPSTDSTTTMATKIKSELEFPDKIMKTLKTRPTTSKSTTERSEVTETTTIKTEISSQQSEPEIQSTTKKIEKFTTSTTNVIEASTEVSSTSSSATSEAAIETMNTSPATDLSTQMKDIISTTETIMITSASPIFTSITDITTSEHRLTTEVIRESTKSPKETETSEIFIESSATQFPQTSKVPQTTEVSSTTESLNSSEAPPIFEVTGAPPLTKVHSFSTTTSTSKESTLTTKSVVPVVSSTFEPDSEYSSTKAEPRKVENKTISPNIKSTTSRNKKPLGTSTISPVMSTVSEVSLTSEAPPNSVQPKATEMPPTSTEFSVPSTTPVLVTSATTFSSRELISTTEKVARTSTLPPQVSIAPEISEIPPTSEVPRKSVDPKDNEIPFIPYSSQTSEAPPSTVKPKATEMPPTSTESPAPSTSPVILDSATTSSPRELISTTEKIFGTSILPPQVSTAPEISEPSQKSIEPKHNEIPFTPYMPQTSEARPSAAKPKAKELPPTSTESHVPSTSPVLLTSATTYSPRELLSTTDKIYKTSPLSTALEISDVTPTSETPRKSVEPKRNEIPFTSTETQVQPTSKVPGVSTTTSSPIKLTSTTQRIPKTSSSTTKPVTDHHSKHTKPKGTEEPINFPSSTTMKSTATPTEKPLCTSTVPSTKTHASFDPKHRKEIEESLDSIELTTRSFATPKTEKGDAKISNKSDKIPTKKLNPSLKSPIDELVETVEITTKATTELILPTFNPQFMTPIDERIDSFYLSSTKNIVESMDDTITRSPSTSRPNRKRPTEWDEDSDEELLFDFDRKPIVPVTSLNPFFKKINDKKPIATTTPINPFFKKVDELPGSDFDPSLKRPIEEPLDPEPKGRPVIKFVPSLKKPIEEPIGKPDSGTRFQIMIKDPSCDCIRPVGFAPANQVPQTEVKVSSSQAPTKTIYRQRPTNVQQPTFSRGFEQPYLSPVNVQPALPRVYQGPNIRPTNILPTMLGGSQESRAKPASVQPSMPGGEQGSSRRPTNIQPTFTRDSQETNLRPVNNVRKISVDDIGDILKPIAVPNEVYHTFPNLRPNNVPRPNYRQTSTPSTPVNGSQNRFYIIPQRSVQNGGPAVQNPIQIIHRYNSGSAMPTVIKVSEQEQPRQFYFKYTPMNVQQRVYIPEPERQVDVPQRWFAGSNPGMTYRQSASEFDYSGRNSGQCYYKVKEGPMLMDGDNIYGRLLISANTCKRCFYCCQNQEYEQCSRTKLSDCSSRNMLQIHQPSSQHVYQVQRDLHHPGNPCKVIETWPNGPHGLPSFKVVCK